MKFGCKAKTSCAEGGLSVKNLANMAGLQFHQKLKTIQFGNLIVGGNEIRRVTRAKNPLTKQRNYGLSSKQGTKRPHFCNINDRGRLVAEFLQSIPIQGIVLALLHSNCAIVNRTLILVQKPSAARVATHRSY